MTIKLRDNCSVFVYERGERSVPFVVDEGLKYPVQLAQSALPVARALVKASEPETIAQAYRAETGAELPPDALDTLASHLQSAGLVEDGRDPVEVQQTLRARWEREHEQALGEAVSIGGARMPMYRSRIPESLRSFGSRFDWDLWDKTPILSRRELRAAFPHGFVGDNDDVVRLIRSGEFALVESSGTSGDERLRVLADLKRSDGAVIASRFLNRDLFPGCGLKQAVFTTLHCAGLMCAHDLPQMDMRVFHDNILTLLPPEDVTKPTKAEVARTIREIKAHGANWLRVNPTYAANLTWAALDHGLELPRLRVLTVGYEYASKIHRKMLAEAWGCPVYSLYAVSEVQGFGMVECEHGTMHVNDRYVHFELFRDGHHCRPGETGRLVVTTLKSRLPLVRYDIGDLFTRGDPGARCPCGSIYSQLGRIAGRAIDAIPVPDGRVLSTAEIDDVVSMLEGIRTYQLTRESQARYQLAVVPSPSANLGALEREATGLLRHLFGPGADVAVAFMPAVFPERTGKFRMTQSRVDTTPPIVATAPAPAERDAFGPLP